MVISERAIIDPSAVIGKDVKIGPMTVIGRNVVIGDGTEIGSHVVIDCHTRIGMTNKIYPFASLGTDPQDLSYTGEDTFLEIGDNNVIREYVTLNRGSSSGVGKTKIGDGNCFLAYSHVAHDCQIGNQVLFVNNATIAGHVTIEDYVILGAFTAVHQFCRVGAYSFLSRATEISKDIPPYMLVTGLPGLPCGLNTVGLKRRGFSEQKIRELKNAFKTLYRRGFGLQEALSQLAQLAKESPEIEQLTDFIRSSKRGISLQIKPRNHSHNYDVVQEMFD